LYYPGGFPNSRQLLCIGNNVLCHVNFVKFKFLHPYTNGILMTFINCRAGIIFIVVCITQNAFATEYWSSSRLYLDLGPGNQIDNIVAAENSGSRIADWINKNPGIVLQPLSVNPVASGRLKNISGYHELQFDQQYNADELVKILSGFPEVKLVERAPVYHTSTIISNDPAYRAQWHLDKINAMAAWAITQGKSEISVAILDTGVDLDHPDLVEKIWINAGEDINGDGQFTWEDENGLDDDNNGFVDDVAGWDFVTTPEANVWPGEDPGPADNDPNDFDGHGTHCAGDAAATGFNGNGVASPAMRVKIMCLRVGYMADDGMGYVTHGLQGMIQAAEYGADVVSMSYGGGGFSQMTQNAANELNQQNIVMVAAAGNENSSQISYPAGLNHVISIGATNQNDERASFSNYGNWVDLGSPGVDILSTTVGGNYGNMQGTSMAAPIAAGVCALLKSLRPDWGGDEILSRLAETAVEMPGAELGAGRIDVGAAVNFLPIVSDVRVNNSARRLLSEVPAELEFIIKNYSDLELSSAELRIGPSSDFNSEVLNVQIPDLLPGEEVIVSVVITWTGTATSKYWIPLEIFAGNSIWSSQYQLPCGVTQLMLIDIDSSDNWSVIPYYNNALNQLDIEVATYFAEYQDPAHWPWQEATNVLLYSGSDLEAEISADLSDSLDAFIDRGGKTILSGQRLASALGAEFLDQRFSAELSNEVSPGALVWGLDGDSLGQGRRLLIIGGDGAENQLETEVLQSTAGIPVFAWSSADFDRLAAVRSVENDLILFTFGLEALNDLPEWASSLSDILAVELGLESAIFPPPAVKPQEMTLLDVWPNPFNPTLNIKVSCERSVEIHVYDVLGRHIASLGSYRPGEHNLNWPASKFSSGMYYISAESMDGTEVKRVVLLK
jgi:subtilisin family serine protease